MKANPSVGILTLFRDLGLHVDASSDFEVERALRAGFAPERVQLTSQMPSRRLADHLGRGVLYNACSLHQLEEFGRPPPAATWRPDEPRAGQRVHQPHQYRRARVQLRDLARVHGRGPAHRQAATGSRSGPSTAISARAPIPRSGSAVTRMTLDLAAQLPEAGAVNLGGGFKVGRMPEEPTVDLADVGGHVREALLEAFARGTAAGAASRDRARHVPGRARRRGGRHAASTWSTPGARATCSPSSTRACPR